MASTVKKTVHAFDKGRLEALLDRRFSTLRHLRSMECCRSIQLRSPGSSLQVNIISEWRKHFIIEQNMLALDTTIMTPPSVFETSGHVARFADWMVKDLKTGDVLHADHLVKNVLEARLAEKKKAAKVTAVKLADEVVTECETILAQVYTDNEVGEPQLFNLMFATSTGPTGQHPGFLPPETAQGHFLNFSRLLEFNDGRVPFASAQIGRSFRNEISPRAGLFHVRKFTMGEIEHFHEPNPPIQEFRKNTTVELTVGEAVQKSIIANETLVYFVPRIYLMAHYAADCWDVEIHNSTGWTECVGCADRAACDLSVHSAKTGPPLVVRQALKEPIVSEKETFKQDTGIIPTVESMDQQELTKLKGQLAVIMSSDDKEFELTPEVLTVELETIKQSSNSKFTPNVIEPSFGLGYILYALLEHSFWSRGQDVERGLSVVFATTFPPTKVLIVPLSDREEFDPLRQGSLCAITAPNSKFRKARIFSRVDDSNTRNDELGTPFGVTSILHRDIIDQRIGPIDKVIAVTELVHDNMDWEEACQRLPAYDIG
ncbi:hypothetical protein BDZ97DRAFT_1904252 [Flammula alnicola]|nr:hypothetical protein BDZ97DRAFT_1904252 [Flammula alnicola]